MCFNPLAEKGIPLDRQLRSWSELNVQPYNKKEYIRQVLANQVNLTGLGTEFVSVEQLPPDARYFEYQKIVNAGGVPSEEAIELHIQQVGKDYRSQTEGAHPVGSAT